VLYAGTMDSGRWRDRRPATTKAIAAMAGICSLPDLLPLLLVSSRAALWIVVFVAMAAYGIEATLLDPAEDAFFPSDVLDRIRQKSTAGGSPSKDRKAGRTAPGLEPSFSGGGRSGGPDGRNARDHVLSGA